jgi:UDP-N-acetylglucosamine 3-dehydrogenase
MKIGILGTDFGMYHAQLYKGLDNVHSLTIFGRNAEKLDEIRKTMGIEVTNNIDTIITNKEIDLIDICLPISMHKEYVIQALKNGKHVFCETPICLTLEDAIAMEHAEKQYDKRVFVNLFIKHEYPYEYVYETIEKNSLGKLKALHIRRKTPPLWGDLGLGKITTNFMIHELDFITWLLGIPTEIFAFGVSGKEGQSHVDAILLYPHTIVEVQSSSMMPQHHPFTVGYEAVFEEGTIEYFEHGYADRLERSLKLFTDTHSEEIPIIEKNCYESSIKHVLECCTKNIPTKLGLADAIQSLKIALEIEEQLLKNDPVLGVIHKL